MEWQNIEYLYTYTETDPLAADGHDPKLDFVNIAKGALADALVSSEWENEPVVERFMDCTAIKGRY